MVFKKKLPSMTMRPYNVLSPFNDSTSLLDTCTNMLPTFPSCLNLYTIQLNVREFQSSTTSTIS
jgi:hypothetical protein